MRSLQTEFPFPSLDFPERGALRPFEIAEKIGVSEDQILKLIDEGELATIDMSSRKTKSGRKWVLIPTESYRNLIVRRLSGDKSTSVSQMVQLPRPVLLRLIEDAKEALNRQIA